MADREVTGGAELAAALQQFGANIERNMMRGALRSGAQVIAEEAKSRVPVDSGELKDSIRVRAGRIRNGKVMYYVQAGSSKPIKKKGPNGKVEYKNPWYAHLVEFGVRAHVIIAGGATKAGKVLASAARVLGEKVDHPGTQAKPFMRPALDNKADDAIGRVAEYLRARIARGK